MANICSVFISQNSNLNSNISNLETDFVKESITSSFATSAVDTPIIAINYNKYFLEFPSYFGINAGTYQLTQEVEGSTNKYARLYLFSSTDMKKIFPNYDTVENHARLLFFRCSIDSNGVAGVSTIFLVKENSLNGVELVAQVASGTGVSITINHSININLGTCGALMI